MHGVNPLLGSYATPEVTTGYASGATADDLSDGAKSRAGDDDFTSVKVAIVLVVGLVFVVGLRRAGFRDMIAV